MKYVLRKILAAELDAAEAARWYEHQQAGLGLRFLDALDVAVEYIAHNPETPAVQFRNARRVRLHTFNAYAVYYVIRREEIIVFAVGDGRRNPAWIKQRRQHLG